MITGHLIHLAVRALGALRTASPPHDPHLHLHPRWVWVAFMVAVVLLLAERNVHHDLTPTLVGVLSNGDVWARFRQWHLEQRHSQETIHLFKTVLHGFWTELEKTKVPGPDGAKVPKQWHQAKPKDFERYLDLRCPPGKTNAGKPRSRSTRALYSRLAKSFYHWASINRLLPGRNPFENWKPIRPPARRPRALPLSTVGELLVELADQQRLRLMVLLGYHQMLRIGEIVRLSVEDFRWDTDPPMLRVQGKGDREVWMPLSPVLVPVLRAYLVSRPPNGPLIENLQRPGEHLSAGYASHMLAEAMRPITGDSAHALRHTGAQQLRRLTKDPFLVKEALRHASLGTVEFYVAPEPTMLANGLAQLPNPLQAPT